MLRTLVAKDLRRARRNPVPWLFSLVVPFLITALIGALFGPRSGGGGLGTIHVALVDEDDTGLTQFLRGALKQARAPEANKSGPDFRLQAEFMERDEAMRRLTDNALSAAIVIRKGFTGGILSETGAVELELIKNPAQAIPPRIIEELLGMFATAADSFKLLAGDMLGDVRTLFESEDDALAQMARAGSLLLRARDRYEPVKAYLAPPLVGTGEETRAKKEEPSKGGGGGRGVFAFILAGMAGMFLLYLADAALRGLLREVRFHTLERFKTLREGLLAFIVGKILFAIVTVLVGAVIILGGGALAFQFTWQRPFALAAIVLAYAFCAAGILALATALAGSERRADMMNNLAIMGLAMAGGCMFPPETFPAFMREHIMTLFPTHWFAATVRELQFGYAAGGWSVALIKMVVLGALTTAAATALFRRRLEKGVRP
jgi:ABC-2 type transport system permease protein